MASDVEKDHDSMATTPAWAAAAVCLVMIFIAALMEHGLHLLDGVLGRRKRRTLTLALYHIQAELRSFGFMSLLLNMAHQPISKICIPQHIGDSLLPCKNDAFHIETTCKDKGKVSLLSVKGADQLLMLIFMLAVSRVLTCLLSFGLAMAKVNRWASWEEESRTMDYRLSHDPRRFVLTHETPFGKRHLGLWSSYRSVMWLVCFVRHLVNSASKSDYFALRHSFIVANFDESYIFDFHMFLKRSLDHDFAAVTGTSHWSWIYVFFSILLNAQGFHSYLWMPFIPLLMLLIVGTKLEVAITTMCIESSKEKELVAGTLSVKPDSKYFWLGKERWLLHAMYFILFQNSFNLAFFIWTWYHFGFPSCFHKERRGIMLGIGIGGLIQLLCAYVTLPLYALVTQMDSTLKKAIFTDNVIQGLRNWRITVKKNLSTSKKSCPTTPPESIHHRPLTEGRLSDALKDDHKRELEIQSLGFECTAKEKGKVTDPSTSNRSYNGEVSFRLWSKQDGEIS